MFSEFGEIYLDNSATTAVLPEIADRMRLIMVEQFGNPSSSHSRGVQAEELVTEARKNIAQALQVNPKEIFFTSGGTEANNWALLGTAAARRRQGNHIVCSAIEHPSVLEVVKNLGQNGFVVDFCPVNQAGTVDIAKLAELVGTSTILVSIMLVNNEIGSIQPIIDLAAACKKKNPNVVFHSDCVQAVGKIPVHPHKLGIDLLSMSAHKFHGPKGTGALYVKNGLNLKSIIYGGGQELGLRSGTENVPGIVGLGMALIKAISVQDQTAQKMQTLKEHLLTRLEKSSVSYRVNGPAWSQAAPHILNLSFAGVRGEVLEHALDAEKIYVSTGSACSSRKTRISHVLKAISLSEWEAEGSIRISLSRFNTVEEMERLAEILNTVVKRLKH